MGRMQQYAVNRANALSSEADFNARHYAGAKARELFGRLFGDGQEQAADAAQENAEQQVQGHALGSDPEFNSRHYVGFKAREMINEAKEKMNVLASCLQGVRQSDELQEMAEADSDDLRMHMG